ncbi:MAG: adenylosuccinate synthase [Pseudomonadota bacterium]
MSNHIVMGAQWGDEGKGKIVDTLAGRVDMIVRFQGGANAGHTIVFGGNKYVLHLLPSGVLSPGRINVIGNGCVVDVEQLAAEIQEIRGLGFEITTETLALSDKAHVVTPSHKHADKLQAGWIGTTGRGIGQCYTDKVRRHGIRMGSILDGTFDQRFKTQNAAWRCEIDAPKEDPFPDADVDLHRMRAAMDVVVPFIVDTRELIHGAARAGREILFEGAQGMLLDIDHGTYPFVTSSSTTIAGAYSGTGVWLDFKNRIGVLKAYTTRVGTGPFPTEQENEAGEALQRRGHEHGATTGRVRRCGWLDLPLVREACITNGYNALVLTKLDVLTGLETIPVAVGRRPDGAPVYEDRPGWEEPLDGAQSDADLPRACRDYISFIEESLDVTVALASYGPDRTQTITRRSLW